MIKLLGNNVLVLQFSEVVFTSVFLADCGLYRISLQPMEFCSVVQDVVHLIIAIGSVDDHNSITFVLFQNKYVFILSQSI